MCKIKDFVLIDVFCYNKVLQFGVAEVAELADASVSKTDGPRRPCGFDSHLRHSLIYPELGDVSKNGRRRNEKKYVLPMGTWGGNSFVKFWYDGVWTIF